MPSRTSKKKISWLLALVAVCLAGFLFYLRWERIRPENHYRRGLAALANKDLEAVREHAAALENTDDYKPHSHLLFGAYLLRSGDVETALLQLNQAAEHSETRAQARAFAGEAFYRARRFVEAEYLLAQALEEDPTLLDARRLIASTYYDLGAMMQALEHLQLVAAAAPEDGRPHRLMGRIHTDYEKYDEAIAELRESLRRDPHPPDLLNVQLDLATALSRNRQYDEALEVLQQAEPTADVLHLQAECMNSLGRADEAKELLARALELQPNHLGSLLMQGAMLLEGGQTEEAAKVLSSAAEHHPTDDKVRAKLMQAYRLSGEEKLADEQLEIMEKLKATRQRFTELHDRALQQPRDAQVRYELGATAMELQRPDLGEMWFRSALAIDPTHAEALESMQRLVNLQGKATSQASDPAPSQ
jgi:tetratricopeptide (TPR) repeat protein